MNGVRRYENSSIDFSQKTLTINNENNFSEKEGEIILPCSYSHCLDIVYSTQALPVIGWKFPPRPTGVCNLQSASFPVTHTVLLRKSKPT